MPAAGHIQLLKATEESIDIGITYECKRPSSGPRRLRIERKRRGRSWQQKSRGKAYFSNDSKACTAAKRRACSNNGWVPIADQRMIHCSTLARFSFAIGVRFLKNLTCSPHGLDIWPVHLQEPRRYLAPGSVDSRAKAVTGIHCKPPIRYPRRTKLHDHSRALRALEGARRDIA